MVWDLFFILNHFCAMKNEDFKVAFLSRIMRRDNALQFFGGREGGFHDRKKKFKQKKRLRSTKSAKPFQNWGFHCIGATIRTRQENNIINWLYQLSATKDIFNLPFNQN